MTDRYMAYRVAARYALKYVPKENKQSKVERLSKLIRERTGLSGGQSKDIADTIVRSGRDIEGLAAQKGWPIEQGVITGPKGELAVHEVREQLDKTAASDIYDIRKPTWDIQQAAREMNRYEFITYFVARMTRSKSKRNLTEGYWVKSTPQGWVILMGELGDTPLSPPTKDLGKLNDLMRRGPLNVYVRQAEDYRVDLLSE